MQYLFLQQAAPTELTPQIYSDNSTQKTDIKQPLDPTKSRIDIFDKIYHKRYNNKYMPEIQKNSELPLGDQLPEQFTISAGDLTAHRCGVDDAPFVFELSQDDQVSRFIPWAGNVDTITDAERVVRSWEESTNQVRYVIVSDGQPAGIFGVWRRDEAGCCETGSALIPLYRGLDIANKVYAAIEPHLAEAGFQKVISTVAISNSSSQAAVIKRGFIEVSRDDSSIRYEKEL